MIIQNKNSLQVHWIQNGSERSLKECQVINVLANGRECAQWSHEAVSIVVQASVGQTSEGAGLLRSL